MFKLKKAIEVLPRVVICVMVFATSATAQTVDLSSRTFWVGESPKTLDSEPPFIAIREIDWIESILRKDPVLKDAVVHIEQTYMSVADNVAEAHVGEVRLGPDRLQPRYAVAGYWIYGAPVATSKSFTYVPVDPAAGYVVFCGERDDVQHFSICVVNATYSPDDRIRLKARLYFPPDPADAPTYFRDVAQRMRDVAYCLDVTDERIPKSVERPNLTECRREPSS